MTKSKGTGILLVTMTEKKEINLHPHSKQLENWTTIFQNYIQTLQNRQNKMLILEKRRINKVVLTIFPTFYLMVPYTPWC